MMLPKHFMHTIESSGSLASLSQCCWALKDLEINEWNVNNVSWTKPKLQVVVCEVLLEYLKLFVLAIYSRTCLN